MNEEPSSFFFSLGKAQSIKSQKHLIEGENQNDYKMFKMTVHREYNSI